MTKKRATTKKRKSQSRVKSGTSRRPGRYGLSFNHGVVLDDIQTLL